MTFHRWHDGKENQILEGNYHPSLWGEAGTRGSLGEKLAWVTMTDEFALVEPVAQPIRRPIQTQIPQLLGLPSDFAKRSEEKLLRAESLIFQALPNNLGK